MSTIKPLAALIALTVMSAAGRYVMAKNSVQVPGSTGLLGNIAFALILTWWVRADRQRRYFAASYEFEALLFFLWFIVLPYYLFQTRRFKGLLMTAGFFVLFITPLFSETFVRALREVSACEICEAARKDDVGKVEAILRTDPKQVFSRDDKGNTPLHVSASRGYLDIAKLLLVNKADVNSRTDGGNTPLKWAAYNGHTDVAALLIADGADVNAKDEKGWTPLSCAVYQGQKDTIELLLANNADVDATNDGGYTPLYLAVEKDYKDIAALLLADNADVDRGKSGWTPLLLAVDKGHEDMAALLLGHKADPNARTHEGWTPLHIAAEKGFKDIVELLLANRADVNARSESTAINAEPSLALYKVKPGVTPYHMAIAKGHKDVAELLRQHGGHE